MIEFEPEGTFVSQNRLSCAVISNLHVQIVRDSSQFPGNFILSYVCGVNIHHVNIEYSPSGFKLEGADSFYFRFAFLKRIIQVSIFIVILILRCLLSLSALIANATGPMDRVKCPLVLPIKPLFGSGALSRRRSRFIASAPSESCAASYALNLDDQSL